MTKAPELNRADMFDVFLRELRGADRVVVETKNALGEYDAHYLHAPEILKAWSARADLSPSPEAFQQMREALEEMTDLARALTSKHICINGQYVEVREAISRARAALKAAEGE